MKKYFKIFTSESSVNKNNSRNMKLIFTSIIFTFLVTGSFAQDSAKMKIFIGSENEDLEIYKG